ncbi:MAG: amino acid transporter, partial [Gemmatimonadetes bacterium 13_1_20CM_4_69_16]
MPEASLARTLRPRDLAFIVVGTVIGSGIFVVPGAVLRQTGGDVGYALLVWLLGGVLSLLGALTYGELGGMLPEAGGAYVYVRDAFGPLAAFLLGWTLFFVISSGSVATLAVAFAEYLRQFVPLDPTARTLVAALMIAVVGAVNVRGTRHSANVQNWSTGIKVAAILAMSAVLLGSGHGLADLRAAAFTAPLGPSLLSGVGVAMIGVLWAYEGWANVAASAGEALEPQRSFPRGIVTGTATLVAIYLLANVAYVAALGPAAVAGTDRVAADAVRAALGPGAGRLIAAAVLVAMFSAANGLTLTNSRVYYAMAR